MPKLPQSVGAHPHRDAEEGARQIRRRSIRSSCRTLLQTALDALYGHYAEDVRAMAARRASTVPPVSSSSATTPPTSKLVYDYISGFDRENEDGAEHARSTATSSCSATTTRHGNPLPRREHAADRQRAARIGRGARQGLPRDGRRRDRALPPRDRASAPATSAPARTSRDQDLLREVMNTVGKPGQLGEAIRCVVSVSMLTEGWDANTVTHILGVRAFGTQLLCEQVVGRGLRRQSYDLNEERPVQRRVCRHPRHPVRLHRQAGRRAAGQAARDDPRSRRAARSRRARNRLSARRRLSRRAARGAAHRQVRPTTRRST